MGAGAQEDEEETAVVAEGGGGGGEEEQVVEEGGGEEEQVVEEGGGEEEQVGEDGGGEGGEEKAAAVVSCSICLDTVVAGGGERSTARLQCGHEFHLDCIGSAFNAKGIMQCPNCRKIEMGNWLYPNGSRSSQDANNDEWGYDEDLYDVAHSDMPTFVKPIFVINEILQVHYEVGELETSAPATFNDFTGPNFNSEHMAVSVPGTAHPGPYLAYFQPVPPPPPSSSHVADRTMDGAAYHDHWNSLAGPSDVRQVQTVHPIDFHHNPWAHMPHSYSQPNNNNGVAEQAVLPPGILRVAGIDSDNQRGSLPSFYGNGSGTPRIPSVPPMAPQFIRAHSNINDQFQQSSSLFAGSQRSGGMHPLGAGGSAVPPPENTSFCLFPPASSGPGIMETEDVRGNQLYAWERDRLAPYPLVSVNNEGSWWSSSQQQQSHGAPEPASASRRLPGQWMGGAARSPPQEMPGQWIGGASRSQPQENRSPDDLLFRPMYIPRM
ncbi:hypothetical protein BAE44_0005310 [Dichanthelium oligosanthes]|uniref:RING-type domain-containing protein n=1 Tax=Dichanthelium oligosanthes TaxID=888268 RepID=A0A1E5W8C3_9POAL|nr:hypothetical protein BAE44_0005310 [Dichanthelium oligosanthes]